MKITLKDGSFLEFDAPISVGEIAKTISEGLFRNAVCGKVDGELVDLSKIVEKDCSLQIITLRDKEGQTFTLDTDSVILSVGYNPAPLAKKSRHVHVIGDASSVGNLRTVIWGAWDICMKI